MLAAAVVIVVSLAVVAWRIGARAIDRWLREDVQL